jgi:hypothetical protein
METTLTLMNAFGDTEGSLKMYLSQAWYRKRFWLCYRIEFELIGAQLRRLRKEKGYSIESAAKTIRMPAYRLYKIECGMYIHFELRHLQRLGKLYNATSLEILSVIRDGSFENLSY